ncbi:Aldehyde dehydrogenase [Salix suchowensis]|nr:Aldehyde dehydrogenase [Salix suchowensis]
MSFNIFRHFFVSSHNGLFLSRLDLHLSIRYPGFKGASTINTGLFIGGKWVDSYRQSRWVSFVLVECADAHPASTATGTRITRVVAASAKDIDIAVDTAKQAYKTAWGMRVPGKTRGRIINKLADLIEKYADEMAALESLNTGKIFNDSRRGDIDSAIEVFRYYAGWADKIHGQVIEVRHFRLVVGQIIPWNFPCTSFIYVYAHVVFFAPALATGNVVVLKPSEITPFTALRFADMLVKLVHVSLPMGVCRPIAGQAISEHLKVDKIMEAAARSNLKAISLELGGKSPNIIFDDADLEQTVKWTAFGILSSVRCWITRVCPRGIYPKFIEAFTKAAQGLGTAIGDPFAKESKHGPQRVMGYIESGKEAGANVVIGGHKHGNNGYFIEPTIFTDCRPDMKIVQEEIFGPVAAVIKFKTEEEVIQMANDSIYGLACAVFTENGSRALRVIQPLRLALDFVPFGGYKQSGTGRDLGQYALDTYVPDFILNMWR